MEDALRGARGLLQHLREKVLILVLMEDALRGVLVDLYNVEGYSLNPCSNGRCSARTRDVLYVSGNQFDVLILVLMEDALREGGYNRFQPRSTVLILVLMEDALRVCH